MHRLPRWPVVLFALVGAVGRVGANPSDEARRMPVGPPDANTPAPVIPAPAAPPPPAPVVMPGPAVSPQFAAPLAPVAPPAQAQQPVASGNAAGQAPAKGAQNNG